MTPPRSQKEYVREKVRAKVREFLAHRERMVRLYVEAKTDPDLEPLVEIYDDIDSSLQTDYQRSKLRVGDINLE